MLGSIYQLHRIVAPALLLSAVAWFVYGASHNSGDRPIVTVTKSEGADGSMVRAARPLMGTIFQLSIWAPPGKQPQAAEALQEAFRLVETIQSRVSSWDKASDTSAVNQNAGQGSVRVGSELIDLLGKSLTLARQTEGAFDITGGPLFELWKQTRKTATLPTDEQIRRCLEIIGHEKVVLSGDRVELAAPGMRIDFGAIGKGYAADRVAELLQSRGFENYIIDAGGDVLVGGSRGNTPWQVAVRHPRKGEFLAVFGASDRAIATSGDYEQFSVIGGERYSHILDTRTGRPARGLVSVSIVARRAADADALATAVFVMGPQRGLEFVESLSDVEALLVAEDGQISLSSKLRFEEGRLEVVQ